MIVKIHKTRDGKKIIAVCDKGLLGKKFEENEMQLDLDSDFYNGREMNEEELEKQIRGAYMINVVGGNSVNFFLNKKIISKKNIIYIKKIPHAQCMMVT